MRTCIFLVACASISIANTQALAELGEELPILETFLGFVDNDKKPELRFRFIADKSEWKKVWEKINEDQELPEIDFSKHFLLFSLQDAADPNRQSMSVVKDDKGVVTATVTSTLIGFESSDRTIFRFYKISREGVTGVGRYDRERRKLVVDPLPK